MKTGRSIRSLSGVHSQLCIPDEIARFQEAGELSAWLASGEQEMAAQLHSAKRRRDWLAGRVAAKRAIALYLEESHCLNLPVSEIVIDYDEQGRPRPKLLSMSASAEDLSLSLAHSDGWGLAAVAHRQWIGVDLQRIRPVRAGLAQRALNPSERVQLAERFRGREAEGFFIYWVLKEAALKALGSGLRLPMRALDIELAAQAGQAELQIRLPGGALSAEGHYWTEPEGFQAALVQLKQV